MPLNKETKLFVAQSAGTVEYTDFFFLPRDKTPHFNWLSWIWD